MRIAAGTCHVLFWLLCLGGMACREPPPSGGGLAVAAVPECSSDFDCGYGNRCVKEPYKFTGQCAEVVNARGAKVIEPPRGRSISEMGHHECYYDHECGSFGHKCVNERCFVSR